MVWSQQRMHALSIADAKMKNTPNPPESGNTPQTTDADPARPATSVEVKSLKITNTESVEEVEFDSNVHGRIVSDQTGKNVYVRDEDASDDISELRILDEWQTADGESEGSDPYDSGSINPSNLWDSKPRK